MILIVVVYYTAHSHIRAHHERLRQCEHAVSATSPVVVAHLTAIHRPYASARFHAFSGIHHAVVERNHYRSSLEHRARFEQVAHSMVLSFAVFAVATLLHIHDGLHVARGNFHDDSHTHVTVYLLQLVYHRPLCQILHRNVYCRDDVGTVNRLCVRYRKETIEHLTFMHQTGLATQHRVVCQLQSVACRVFSSIQFTERTARK